MKSFYTLYLSWPPTQVHDSDGGLGGGDGAEKVVDSKPAEHSFVHAPHDADTVLRAVERVRIKRFLHL